MLIILLLKYILFLKFFLLYPVNERGVWKPVETNNLK